MSMSVILNIISIGLLVPAPILAFCARDAGAGSRWFCIFIAIIGASVAPSSLLLVHWDIGVGFSIWITIFAILLLFAITCIFNQFAHKLTILLFPYLIFLSICAASLSELDKEIYVVSLPSTWVIAHIVSSIITYAIISLAAIAALCVYLSQNVLKNKNSNNFISMLPAINEGNHLQLQLLSLSALILIIGLITGMALQYYSTQSLLVFDHKTILTVLAFVVLVGVICLQSKLGVRGKIAARFVLLAYLLLTLAYPGVKFVGQILL